MEDLWWKWYVKILYLVFFWKQESDVELRHLSADAVQTDSSNVVYLIRPQLTVMKTITSHIQNDISKGVQKKYFIYFVPRRTVACEKVLTITNILYPTYKFYFIGIDHVWTYKTLEFYLYLLEKEDFLRMQIKFIFSSS
jgi:hypothetical protein